MKALLMKDFYTLWRQLRVYLLVMLVISLIKKIWPKSSKA